MTSALRVGRVSPKDGNGTDKLCECDGAGRIKQSLTSYMDGRTGSIVDCGEDMYVCCSLLSASSMVGVRQQMIMGFRRV